MSPETNTGPGSDTAHLFAIDTGEEFLAKGVGGGINGLAPAASLISKEDFFGLFKFSFSAPNMALAAMGKQPLTSLPIADAETAQARAASDAIYDICEETPALHWMLAPDAPWIQRTIPIIIFAQAKAFAVASELRARRARPVQATPVQASPLREGDTAQAVQGGPLRASGTAPDGANPVTETSVAGDPQQAQQKAGTYPKVINATVH